MAVLPAAAAAAYQAAAAFGSSATGAGAGAATGASAGIGGNFSDFLNSAIKDSVSTMAKGEQMAAKQLSGQADIIDVVNAVNAAETTLDTVVAVRDKVIQAYQSIMNMPI